MVPDHHEKMRKRWLVGAIVLLSLATLAASLVSQSASAGTPGTASAASTVSISNFQFAPRVVRVKAGSEVTWQVKEGTHTVTADNGAFESPTLSAGQKFSHEFATAGTYRYYCSFHGSKGGHDMAGTVIVVK
jgi:plastocyanin